MLGRAGACLLLEGMLEGVSVLEGVVPVLLEGVPVLYWRSCLSWVLLPVLGAVGVLGEEATKNPGGPGRGGVYSSGELYDLGSAWLC